MVKRNKMLGLKSFYALILVLPCSIGKSLAAQLPCNYTDTVNITNGEQFANGSYLHDGIMYPLKYIGVWDYDYVNFTIKTPVQPHSRGCLCKIKKCIRVCCSNFMTYDDEQSRCNEAVANNVSTILPLAYSDQTKDEDVKSFFGVVYGSPCSFGGYFLDPSTRDSDKWNLTENGTVYRQFDNAYVDKDNYCLGPTLEENETVMYLSPLMCYGEIHEEAKNFLYGIALLITIPFMAITILIYASIPELRNLHGKSLCCYLFALTTGNSCLGYIFVSGGIYPGTLICKIIGCVTYYSYMASFLWLNIICFDLWWNFRGVAGRSEKRDLKRFGAYSFYSWGLALLFLIMVIVFQNSNLPDDMKPGIGGGTNCFLNVETWMQLIYFYGQILLTISINSIVFILTLRKIHQVNKEMNKMVARGQSGKNFNREKSRVVLFLRLFIIMGVTWSTEIIAWLCNKKYQNLFYITDVWNAVLGVLIFILFVLRKRVKVLLLQRYAHLRGIQGKRSWYTKSHESAVRSESSTNQEDERGPLKKQVYAMASVKETEDSN